MNINAKSLEAEGLPCWFLMLIFTTLQLNVNMTISTISGRIFGLVMTDNIKKKYMMEQQK